MLETTLFNNLTKLGYSQNWLDTGLLTEQDLDEQLKRFHFGEDQNLEHYRYNTLINFIDNRQSLSNEELNKYLQIINSESDILIAGSATAKLLGKVYLTEEQFKKVSILLSTFGEWTEEIIIREILIRKLKTKNLTEELFEESLLTKDKVLHNILLGFVENDREKLERLIKKAANSKIRNQACQLLKRMNYR